MRIDLAGGRHVACRPTARRRRDDGGAAAVEFALVAPILLVLVFAIISFGFLFGQDLALGNAARQVARYGAVEGRTCGDVKAEAVSAAAPLVDMNASGSTVVIKRGTASGAKTTICGTNAQLPCKGSGTNDNIYVTLTFTADVLIPVVPGMGSSEQLDGEGVFRCEWF